MQLVRDHLFPRLPRQAPVSDFVRQVQRVRGWNFTKAAVLDALFDLRRREGSADPLDGDSGERRERIPVGISLGLFDDTDEAQRRAETAVRKGFRRLKFKVSPGMSLEPLRAVREAFPTMGLAFDANGSGSAADVGFFESLAELRPLFVEQPFSPPRLDLSAGLRERLPGLEICLDESVHGLGDLISAHRLGALDSLNLKPGRVGGPIESVRILDYCREHELPVWVGGMFETGIGRAASLRVAARLAAAAAHDLSPPLEYLAEDLVRRPLRMDSSGLVSHDGRPVDLAPGALERLGARRAVLEKR